MRCVRLRLRVGDDPDRRLPAGSCIVEFAAKRDLSQLGGLDDAECRRLVMRSGCFVYRQPTRPIVFIGLPYTILR